MVDNNVMISNFPLLLNRKVYNERNLPVLTHGSETWNCIKALQRKLQSAQRKMERIILDITWKDRKSVSWIREQTKVEDILTTIKRKVDMDRTHYEMMR